MATAIKAKEEQQKKKDSKKMREMEEQDDGYAEAYPEYHQGYSNELDLGSDNEDDGKKKKDEEKEEDGEKKSRRRKKGPSEEQKAEQRRENKFNKEAKQLGKVLRLLCVIDSARVADRAWHWRGSEP